MTRHAWLGQLFVHISAKKIYTYISKIMILRPHFITFEAPKKKKEKRICKHTVFAKLQVLQISDGRFSNKTFIQLCLGFGTYPQGAVLPLCSTWTKEGIRGTVRWHKKAHFCYRGFTCTYLCIAVHPSWWLLTCALLQVEWSPKIWVMPFYLWRLFGVQQCLFLGDPARLTRF